MPVQHIIAHKTIENALKNLGLQPTTQMDFLRTGLKKPKFERIKDEYPDEAFT